MVLQWCIACQFSHPSTTICPKSLPMWKKAKPKKAIKLEFGASVTQTQVNSFFRKRKSARSQPLNVAHPKSGCVDLRDEDNPQEVTRTIIDQMPLLEPLDQSTTQTTMDTPVTSGKSNSTQPLRTTKDQTTQTEWTTVSSGTQTTQQTEDETAEVTVLDDPSVEKTQKRRTSRRRRPRNWLDVS